jgi:hypothetical protein
VLSLETASIGLIVTLEIVAAATGLRCRSAILDGEVIVQNRQGASDFEALQNAIRSRRRPLIFYATMEGTCANARKTGARRALLAKTERGGQLVYAVPGGESWSEGFFCDIGQPIFVRN